MKQRAHRRLSAMTLTFGAVVALGLLIRFLPATNGPSQSAAAPSTPAAEHAQRAREAEIKARFEQAVAMLHAKKYDYAVAALHRLLELAPRMPEAHVNMGYALLGLKDYAAARDFFNGAIALKPDQVNAYYGLAEALEQLHDLEGALGAMRTYVHLSPPDDPYLAKANAAIWEWGNTLKQQRAKQDTAGPKETERDK